MMKFMPGKAILNDFLFENLNEAQKRVVLHKNGPLLVLAGAGSGKTKSISHRIAHLISRGIEPEKILAITFTNKAAKEMRERIMSLLRNLQPPIHGSHNPFVSTFHALGVYILRKSGKKIGVPKNFSILDKEDSLAVVKTATEELKIDPKQFQPGKMQAIISKQKGELMDSESYKQEAGKDFFPSALSKIWSKYEEQLNKQRALDFDDLITKTVFLLEKDKEARDYYQNFWHYILIDEYQDTNKSQYELSKILAGKHKNICAIGDIDQCIYAFRGADFRNIINFENDYPEHVSIALEENYRSTQNILEAAARVIEKNKMRKPKELYTRNKRGAEISLFEAMNEQEEAEFVVHKVKELFSQKHSFHDIAILFRANFQSRVLEEACLKHQIPYQMLGVQFYERKEVKDFFSYLKAAINRSDLMSVKRIINMPPRGIGKVSIVNKFAGKELPAAGEKKFKEFMNLLDSINRKILKEKTSNIIRFILEETGMRKFLGNGDSVDKERLENLKELVTIATRYDNFNPPEGTEKLLIDSALMSAQDALDKKKDGIRLMTVHAAKGLEFKNVFIAGMEEGLFPHSGFGEGPGEKNEEERRLFYVALTRAKEKLFLSFSVTRTIFGGKQVNMPSRFLSDIPGHLYKMEEFKTVVEDVIRYV
mgnify:CR=1 FL=1